MLSTSLKDHPMCYSPNTDKLDLHFPIKFHGVGENKLLFNPTLAH